ncbi:MAG: MmgE/PrpD family protein [Alphaproteobacteria bacterium]
MAKAVNPFADPAVASSVTADAAAFIQNVGFSDLPQEAVRIGRRCLLDGLGLIVAGGEESTVRILAADAADRAGRPEALLLGAGETWVPAPDAARVLGTAGHAHDWDDSQVSTDPEHVYGLLTHPTIPPLAAALSVVQAQARTGRAVDGRHFMLALLTGMEVEMKLSEWMLPQHYLRGFHSSGTVGAFGACAAAAKLLGLADETLRHALGITASLASGIRANFGTMTKPLHVGRAAENGVTAVRLAARGFTADPDALDGPWGFMAVTGGGLSPHKLAQGFGRTWSITEPGVSIKPYPCGVLTHPTLDLMGRLMRDHAITADRIDSITVYAGSNILNPIRYPVAANHLQAKFSLPAALAMIALTGRAGKREFSDDFVASAAMQAMQRRIRTALDPQIEAAGFDRMRSRMEIGLTDGRTAAGWADERYRGGPENPLSDRDVEDKLRSCCDGALDPAAQDRLIATAWSVLELSDASLLAQRVQTG